MFHWCWCIWMPESPKRNWTTAYSQTWLGKVSTKYKLRRITFPEKRPKNLRFKCVILLNQNESDNDQWPNWMIILKTATVTKALSRVTKVHIKSMSSGILWVTICDFSGTDGCICRLSRSWLLLPLHPCLGGLSFICHLFLPSLSSFPLSLSLPIPC